MTNKSGNISNFNQLFTDIKDYVKLQGDYVKIEFVEKITKILSLLLFILIVVVLAIGMLFYLLFSLAYILAPTVGFVISFGIIAGIYLVLLTVVLIFRKSLIVNPLLRLIVAMFYDDAKEDNEIRDGIETDN